ncbi:MAG: aminopeptidase, partial [Natronomonas sp.]|nr:aminopeptidase [Natronomonas sp.]
MDASLQAVARRVLEENMGVNADESLLVVTDTDKRAIGQALFDAAVELGLNAGVIETRPLERSGMEPPAYVARAMQAANVVVCPTSTSL